MVVAILAGLGAGALWALAFIAPRLVLPFGSSDLTLVRYAVFGMSSVLLLAVWPKAHWWPVAKAHWRVLLLLAMTGNTIYYLLLAEALQRSGVLLPTMIIGTLPVALSLAGGLRNGTFSFRRFSIPIAFILVGLLTHTGAPMTLRTETLTASQLFGLLLAWGSVACWTFYALKNAELLTANNGIDIIAWTALTGVATMLTILPMTIFLPGEGLGVWLAPAETARLLFWGSILGLLSSWAATWLWNVASRILSGELLGYLIVFETVFGILYAFLLDWRLPTVQELSGIALLVGGVALGIRTASRARTIV